ncbi:MAG: hypothetical protein JWR80_5119 [Bradyrhizobium sp.]|nr:hypothetical protein [Bradyrhizobium sp.]
MGRSAFGTSTYRFEEATKYDGGPIERVLR